MEMPGAEIPESQEYRFNIVTRIFTCICVVILSPIILIFINYVAISNVLMGNTFDVSRLPIISAIMNKNKNNNNDKDFNKDENQYAVEEEEEV